MCTHHLASSRPMNTAIGAPEATTIETPQWHRQSPPISSSQPPQLSSVPEATTTITVSASQTSSSKPKTTVEIQPTGPTPKTDDEQIAYQLELAQRNSLP